MLRLVHTLHRLYSPFCTLPPAYTPLYSNTLQYNTIQPLTTGPNHRPQHTKLELGKTHEIPPQRWNPRTRMARRHIPNILPRHRNLLHPRPNLGPPRTSLRQIPIHHHRPPHRDPPLPHRTLLLPQLTMGHGRLHDSGDKHLVPHREEGLQPSGVSLVGDRSALRAVRQGQAYFDLFLRQLVRHTVFHLSGYYGGVC